MWPWRWRANNFDKTESLSLPEVYMCEASTQKWPNIQITLFKRTRQSAWLDSVTNQLTRSEWILVYSKKFFLREFSNKNIFNKKQNALSDPLLISRLPNFAAGAQKKRSKKSTSARYEETEFRAVILKIGFTTKWYKFWKLGCLMTSEQFDLCWYYTYPDHTLINKKRLHECICTPRGEYGNT